MKLVNGLFAVGALLFVFGLGFVVVGARSARQAASQPTQAAAATLRPVASMRQLMNGIIDPAATHIWDAVSTTSSERGIEEVFPRNDAEWAAVADNAAVLAEAGNLLMLDGRAVDRDQWQAMSVALIDGARKVMQAVDQRSTEAVLDAGSEIYTACDNCHMRYQR